MSEKNQNQNAGALAAIAALAAVVRTDQTLADQGAVDRISKASQAFLAAAGAQAWLDATRGLSPIECQAVAASVAVRISRNDAIGSFGNCPVRLGAMQASFLRSVALLDEMTRVGLPDEEWAAVEAKLAEKIECAGSA